MERWEGRNWRTIDQRRNVYHVHLALPETRHGTMRVHISGIIARY